MFRKKASAGIENDHPGRYLRSAWAAIEAVIVTKKTAPDWRGFSSQHYKIVRTGWF
jgi:hypothetical protein